MLTEGARMGRWTTYLWRVLAAAGEADFPLGYPYPAPAGATGRDRASEVDLDDEASVDAAFRSIIEREWGAAGVQNDAPSPRSGRPGIDAGQLQALPRPFWPWFFPW